jgi:UPF0755 protein
MRKKIVLSILAIITLVVGFVVYTLFRPAVSNKKNTFFYIQSGDKVSTVKRHLMDQQFISGSGFDLASTILRLKNVKPGRYKFSDGTSIYSLIKMLRSGDQELVKVVINKERTKELFAGKIGAGKRYDLQFDSTAMINYLNNNDSLKKFGVDTNTVMALFVPNTYSQKWNTTPDKLLQQFYAAYKKFWTDERKVKADSLHLTPLQVITMASIVEEETNKKEDKYKIASTYINRIRTGMKLQADPTVRYATKDFTLKRITGTLLKINSPYNTYMYAGLPPGPICTPTAETIDAVLNAPKTDYLFFVASHKFDGTSVFTSNLTDHSKYARLYQQELTRRMDSSRKAKQLQTP